MNDNPLPLLVLFRQLRRHGLPLGLDDYLVVLRAWRAGFGLDSRAALRDLCLTVWARSEADARLIELLFNASFPLGSKTAPDDEIVAQISKHLPSGAPLAATVQVTARRDLGEPPQIVQAIRRAAGAAAPDLADRTGGYLPVTAQQMKESWRYLRRPVRQGPRCELDLAATIDRISRRGTLYRPVLAPLPRNQARLLLLVDQKGSMTPFHGLTRQLVHSASHNDRLAGVYYFHDYPAADLYGDPDLSDARPTDAVLRALAAQAMVMIVGDAGAARGSNDAERVAQTLAFLARLRAGARRLVWLNPLPPARWAGSSAAAIAAAVPMFPMNRAGHDAAVHILRGRRVRPVQIEAEEAAA